MKKNKTVVFILIVVCVFILTGCDKKIGIGSKNLFNTYYGIDTTKAKKYAPKYEILGDENSGFVIIDEKAGFSLVLSYSKERVDQVIVFYTSSSDNKKQAQLMLDPPSDATCHEIDGSLWGRGVMQYICYKRNK